MEENKKIYDENDQLARELFDSFSPSEPSEDFTKNTMNMVLQEWSSHPEGIKEGTSVQFKVLIGVAVVFIIFLVYVFDVKQVTSGADFASMFNMDYSGNALNESLGNIVSAFKQIPLVVYLVTFGVATLVFADKLIQRLVSS